MSDTPTHVTINFFIFGQGETLDEDQAERKPDQGLLQRWTRLTPREQEIALLAARNLTNKEIAYNLTISTETVKTHMRHVLGKLDFPSKPDLRFALVKNGLAYPLEVDIYENSGA